MPRLRRKHHSHVLRHAQDLWELGCAEEAIAELEAIVPSVHPKTTATDAIIVATLATYCSAVGEPHRGLSLLSQVPLDGTRLTDVSMICLAARGTCRAAAGDVEGAARDRAAIVAFDPMHPSIALMDAGPCETQKAESGAPLR